MHAWSGCEVLSKHAVRRSTNGIKPQGGKKDCLKSITKTRKDVHIMTLGVLPMAGKKGWCHAGVKLIRLPEPIWCAVGWSIHLYFGSVHHGSQQLRMTNSCQVPHHDTKPMPALCLQRWPWGGTWAGPFWVHGTLGLLALRYVSQSHSIAMTTPKSDLLHALGSLRCTELYQFTDQKMSLPYMI
jgi:hypothetical protein